MAMKKSEVGAGSALDLGRIRRIHVIGIGGAGMSAIAEVLAAMGHQVSGSDLRSSPVLDHLSKCGVSISVGHDPDRAAAADLVAVSTAVPAADPEVTAARRSGVPVLARARILAAICATRRTVTVAGTHGKTTTSSMLSMALAAAGTAPSWIVGARFAGSASGAHWDSGPWLVVEADESDGTFTELPSAACVVTNIEPDHLEHYGSFDHLVGAFGEFLEITSGPRVVWADDPLVRSLGMSAGAVSYGMAQDADFRMVDVRPAASSITFSLVHEGRTLGPVNVPLPGRHNAANAAGALATAVSLGMPFDRAAAGVAAMGGVARRFEFRGEVSGVTFVDDYAHLPGEVAAALGAAADGGWRRIFCVFQPHRYSRTAALAADFGPAFDLADVVIVTDIYAAGEDPRPGVSAELITAAVRAQRPDRPVLHHGDRLALVAELARRLRPGDLCLTLGAGDITTAADEVQSLLGRS